ncbi:TRAP transporter small permease [Gracilibacillus caseinilyticus]|uniref:TRAP transporter small permease n=1 Tax=Gracilibacillus caseinilyticus TaxID=2932256 RepID=A0ABY4EXU9_9BACI|nr:TRAP transporter small permease [Gracilibacillus caseinilyticus]UOQ49240.1 TRAP transporter small permease [Gracilibacillus caseinilyticus]
MGKVIGFIDNIEKVMIASGIFLTSVIIFVNVILRYFFDSGIVWAEESVRYIIIYIVMLGSSLAVTKNDHIAVSIFENSSVEWFAHLIYGLQTILSLVFVLVTTYFGIVVVNSVQETAQISPAMQIPMWSVYMIFPISTALMSVKLIYNVIIWIKTKQIPSKEGDIQ